MAIQYTKENLESGLAITMSAQLKYVDQACHDTDKFLRTMQLQNLLFDIQLGIREALVNAVKHGSQNDSRKQIFFQIKVEKPQIVIKVKDEGKGFNRPSVKNHDGDTLLCCGRGIQIMYKYFDKVEFNRQGNEIQLLKRIDV